MEPAHRSRRGRSGERGIALLLALLVLVILALLVTQMSVSSLHNRTVSGNHLSDLQNGYGARSGYHQAVLLLESDLEKAPDVDSLRERWAEPFALTLGRASVEVKVLDAERFINLSKLVNDKGEVNAVVAAQLRRLLRVLRHPPDVAERIIDYIDADNKGEFESKARNERLHSLDELLRIEGLPPEAVYGGTAGGEERRGLRDFVTVWPKTGEGGGLVNVNTAPAEVLASLSDDMTLGIGQAIAAYRDTPGADGRPQAFEKPEDLKKVTGLTDALFPSIANQITVKATTFEIRSRSTVGNVRKTWVYAVKRGSGQAPPPAAPPPPPSPGDGAPAATAPAVTLLGAQPMHDFLTAQPPAEEE